MALEGTIRDFGLADILQLIGIQRRSGVLTLENDQDTVIVKFLDGQVVGADNRVRNLEDMLGSVLVRTGRITESQLAEALKVQRTTLQRLGYVLVKNGHVSEEDLHDALQIQVLQIVYRLFRWREGRYRFDPSEHIEYDREHFSPVSAETILMEGARMIDEWPIIERRIKSPGLVFRRTEAGAALVAPVQSLVDSDIDMGFSESRPDSVRLSPEAAAILRLVDGRASVLEITERSPLGEFDVYHTLHDLANRQLITEVEELPAEPAAERGRVRRLAERASAAALGVASLLGLVTGGFSPLAPWSVEAKGEATSRLKGFASRARIENVDRAVRVFYLDLAGMPETLDALVETGYLRRADVMDAWGRPFGYEVSSEGYRITGLDGSGNPSPDLELFHRFTPSQRLILEGQAQGSTPRLASRP